MTHYKNPHRPGGYLHVPSIFTLSPVPADRRPAGHPREGGDLKRLAPTRAVTDSRLRGNDGGDAGMTG
ncbi:hypothetical protein HFP51_12560 [Parasphingopyxis sp. CP4]|uniref:hypothetical protein n=1 Tax=Parasphingopyxis sp. CP4 TaxID=2724527 RepID=UPI0015A12019|nr:hypothetical protein [Parasphingopyxis sp. CP4]QLC22943.1 hypothetical protein HFP51_12560 [Parasphingopyxis sp. CP4]